jgi:hypothetical protein
VTDSEFYNALNELVEKALATGLSRSLVIEDLRLLADALDNEDRDR